MFRADCQETGFGEEVPESTCAAKVRKVGQFLTLPLTIFCPLGVA